jgi:AbrB family looped-hinge helix DNA binding protein
MNKAFDTSHIPPYRVRVASGGRIVIPAEVRQELGIKEGEEILISRGQDGYRLTTYREAIQRAQDLFTGTKKPGEMVVDEFLRERCVEAEKENRDYGARKRNK